MGGRGTNRGRRMARTLPRWYMGMHDWRGSKGVAQITLRLSRAERNGDKIELPEPVLRLAQDEYDRQFPGQPYERMQQRGGLSVLEIISLLCDRIERHEKLGPWAEGRDGGESE